MPQYRLNDFANSYACAAKNPKFGLTSGSGATTAGTAATTAADADAASSGMSTGAKAGIGAGIGAAVLALVIVGALLFRRRRRKQTSVTKAAPQKPEHNAKPELDGAALAHGTEKGSTPPAYPGHAPFDNHSSELPVREYVELPAEMPYNTPYRDSYEMEGTHGYNSNEKRLQVGGNTVRHEVSADNLMPGYASRDPVSPRTTRTCRTSRTMGGDVSPMTTSGWGSPQIRDEERVSHY
jgi:hypothetical protein